MAYLAMSVCRFRSLLSLWQLSCTCPGPRVSVSILTFPRGGTSVCSSNAFLNTPNWDFVGCGVHCQPYLAVYVRANLRYLVWWNETIQTLAEWSTAHQHGLKRRNGAGVHLVLFFSFSGELGGGADQAAAAARRRTISSTSEVAGRACRSVWWSWSPEPPAPPRPRAPTSSRRWCPPAARTPAARWCSPWRWSRSTRSLQAEIWQFTSLTKRSTEDDCEFQGSRSVRTTDYRSVCLHDRNTSARPVITAKTRAYVDERHIPVTSLIIS